MKLSEIFRKQSRVASQKPRGAIANFADVCKQCGDIFDQTAAPMFISNLCPKCEAIYNLRTKQWKIKET